MTVGVVLGHTHTHTQRERDRLHMTEYGGFIVFQIHSTDNLPDDIIKILLFAKSIRVPFHTLPEHKGRIVLQSCVPNAHVLASKTDTFKFCLKHITIILNR